MTEPTDSPLAEPIRYEDEEKYLVRNGHEIRRILQALIERRALVSGCAMPRYHTFPTSIVEVLDDDDAVLIDGSASETINLLLYLTAFSYYDIGYASAIVVVFFVLILAITLVLLRIRQREAWQ